MASRKNRRSIFLFHASMFQIKATFEILSTVMKKTFVSRQNDNAYYVSF